MENTSPRGRDRSNRNTPVSSQRAIHFASSPSRAGFPGSDISRSYTEIGELVNSIHQFTKSSIHQLLECSLYSFDLLADQPFRDRGDEIGDRLADDAVGELSEHALRQLVEELVNRERPGRTGNRPGQPGRQRL